LTSTDTARDGRRPRRYPLLIGLAVATASIGAGAASAQTPDPVPDAAEPVEETLAPAPASEEQPAPETAEEAPLAEESAGSEATSEDAEKARRGEDQLKLTLEEASPNKVFWSGKRKAKFTYEFAGSRSVDLLIDVVKSKSGADPLVRRYRLEDRQGGKTYELRWDGKRDNGDSVKKGNMYFRVSEAGGRRASRSNADGNRSFRVFPAIFPVDGPHDYWDGWGAGRGHQGQDVGARCGTPLRAAEPGKVTTKAFDGGGYGYYIVIAVKGSDRSEVYAHMIDQATVAQGSRVNTGERIGKVGSTGNSTGCHLHFEYRPDGVPSPKATDKLKLWDKWS
jgi:murein DD-endopeptidase MepM/ murein hydrolase activator NlpD